MKLAQFARDFFGWVGVVSLKLEPHWNHGTAAQAARTGRFPSAGRLVHETAPD